MSTIAGHISGLMRKFKIERSDKRTDVTVTVQLSGIDASGNSLHEDVRTINVSRHGALLTGIRGQLRTGTEVTLARSGRREKFVVAWFDGKRVPGSRQVGVTSVDAACSFWNDLIESEANDGNRTMSDYLGVEAKAKTMAQHA